jgi:BspA type Leucine rich repeat region (6 copies)
MGAASTILQQPQSQTVVAGNIVIFRVVATGSEPLRYVWYLNGKSIQGATGPSLTVSSAGTLNAGTYFVIVANQEGSVISASAVLTVTLPVTPSIPYDYSTDNGTITITGYTGSGGDVTIPNTINGLPVTVIGNTAFYFSTNLTSVTIPNSVLGIQGSDVIETGAFARCTSLTNVTIGNRVFSIGDRAFMFCRSLTSVKIPNGVTSIGLEAFLDCESLTSVTIPSTVTSIGVEAFMDCRCLTSVTTASRSPTA